MKKIMLLLLLALPITSTAQLHILSESESFEEPTEGSAKLMLLKNGNTVFIHVTIKDGIYVRLYDSGRQLISSKGFKPSYNKLYGGSIDGVFDFGDHISLFISEIDGRTPVFYELKIDTQTGKLIEEKVAGKLDPITMGKSYAIADGNVPEPGYMVRKDATSDNYGIICYNSFESDREKVVELVQYAGDGTETGRHFISSPDGTFKYTRLMDYVIVGKDAYVLLYVYNTKSSGGVAMECLLAYIINGELHYMRMGGDLNQGLDYGLLTYNPYSNKLFCATIDFDNTVQCNMADPANPSAQTKLLIYPESLKANYTHIFTKEKSFGPFPQQFYFHPDGSFTVLMEQLEAKYRQSGSSSAVYRIGTELGSSAVVTYSKEGKELSSLLIPKRTEVLWPGFGRTQYYAYLESFHQAERERTVTTLSIDNQYKLMQFLPGKNKNYVLLNDIDKNKESYKKGKLTKIKAVGACDGYVFDLGASTDAVPSRSLVFKNEKEHVLGLFITSDFNRDKGVFVTLRTDGRDKENRQSKIVWMTE